MTINYISEVGILQHFLQLRKIPRAARGPYVEHCAGLIQHDSIIIPANVLASPNMKYKCVGLTLKERVTSVPTYIQRFSSITRKF